MLKKKKSYLETWRQKLDRPLVRVYHRHAGTQFPEPTGTAETSCRATFSPGKKPGRPTPRAQETQAEPQVQEALASRGLQTSYACACAHCTRTSAMSRRSAWSVTGRLHRSARTARASAWWWAQVPPPHPGPPTPHSRRGPALPHSEQSLTGRWSSLSPVPPSFRAPWSRIIIKNNTTVSKYTHFCAS